MPIITSTDITASVLVSASAFYGDGSNLTNLPSSGGGGGIFTEINGSSAATTSSVSIGTSGNPQATLHVSSSTPEATFFQISDPAPASAVNANPLTTAQMTGILLKVTGSGFIFGEQNTFFRFWTSSDRRTR